MRFGVLGPVAVVRNQDFVPIRAAMPRAVLAALLLEANTTVSTERLVHVLWGDDPPPSATASLQNHVMRLRRVLGDTDGARIRAVPPGYLIRVEAGELDVDAFTELSRRGHRLYQAGKLAAAANELREALELWRGEPLADVASPALQQVQAPRLNELRLQATEWRIEADLRLDRHDTLVPELEAVIAAHPLRERFYGQLMLALYRCGRQADALETFHRLRRTLVDELGVEPTAPIRALQQRILAADPSLNDQGATSQSNTATAEAAPQPLPAQLPADLTDYTGRAMLVKVLRDTLTAAPDGGQPTAVPVVAVTGQAGIGKTALAVHVAHGVADSFPDGQLFADLRGADANPRTADEVLAEILRELGVEEHDIPDGEQARAARYRSLLAGRRVLVVLDNVADTRQARSLIPGYPGCSVLMTSRNKTPGLAGAVAVDLGGLDDEEARQLFTTVVGDDRPRADPDATETILTYCAGLPLAIRIAASRLATRPTWDVATIAARLTDERRRLDELGGADVAVRSGFQMSYANLRRSSDPGIDQARAFRLLGLYSGPVIGLPAASALLGIDDERALLLLENLVDVSLVGAPGPDRYALHDLLHVYAAELVGDEEPYERRRDAAARLTMWCLRSLAAADRTLVPLMQRPDLPADDHRIRSQAFESYDEALAWCDRERAMLVTAVSLAADYELHRIASLIPTFFQGYFHLRGRFPDWLATNEAGLRSARVLGDTVAEAGLLTARGEVLGRTGRLDEAHGCLEQALAIRTGNGDLSGEMAVRINLGTTLERLERYPEALEQTVQGLSLARRTGNRNAEAYSLNNLGVFEDHLGEYDDAMVHYEACLAIHRESGNIAGQGLALLNIGETQLHQGRTDDGLRTLKEALPSIRAGGDNEDEAGALTALGRIEHERGRHGEAREYLRQALVLWQSLGDPRAESTAEILADIDRSTPLPPDSGTA